MSRDLRRNNVICWYPRSRRLMSVAYVCVLLASGIYGSTKKANMNTELGKRFKGPFNQKEHVMWAITIIFRVFIFRNC